jgi:hypothetical protein
VSKFNGFGAWLNLWQQLAGCTGNSWEDLVQGQGYSSGVGGQALWEQLTNLKAQESKSNGLGAWLNLWQ